MGLHEYSWREPISARVLSSNRNTSCYRCLAGLFRVLGSFQWGYSSTYIYIYSHVYGYVSYLDGPSILHEGLFGLCDFVRPLSLADPSKSYRPIP